MSRHAIGSEQQGSRNPRANRTRGRGARPNAGIVENSRGGLRSGRRVKYLVAGLILALLTPLAAVATNGYLQQDQEEADQPLASQILGTLPVIPAPIRALLQDRQYDQAVQALETAIETSPDQADQLHYLKARAHALAKNYDEAIESFQELEEQYPQSAWIRQSRFASAIAYMRKGNYRSAEQIYRAEAEYLLGAERKQEIAAIYLEFADLYFHPEQETTNPDYQKARTFYLQAMEAGPAADRREEVELRIARCAQMLGEFPQAAAGFDAFVNAHSESELSPVARFRLGECYMAQGNAKAARRAWQDLLASTADEPVNIAARGAIAAANADNQADAADAIAQEPEQDIDFEGVRFEETRYRIAQTYGIPHPQTDEALDLGVSEIRTFLNEHPTDKAAAQAHLDIVRSFASRGRWEDAVNELQGFLADENRSTSDKAPEARVMLGVAYQSQKKLAEAIAAWTDYLSQHPAHREWTNVQRMIVDTEYLQGYEALAAEDFEEARGKWNEFLRKHPLEDRCRQILFDFGRMEYLQDRFDEAIAAWRVVVSKYPGSNEASRAQYMIALTLETRLDRLDDALEEFAKVTYGSFQPQAMARHAALTQTAMGIATTRIFRTDEEPTVEITSRNIESYDVSAYRIDMETYFRKMHLARGVENLDVALIDPDLRFTFDVPDYQEYQQFQSPVAIREPATDPSGEESGDEVANRAVRQLAPAGQPQVMAVTVSSDKLEATTLVVQSDLDIVVKSSRDEVFVFAQNMRTGEAWPGVRLLISDGTTVFAEAETGDDGVFQGSFDELMSPEDVRVFAVADGHMASNIIGLSGVGVAQGLSDKGYIYTDRPLYRAGQFVHVRGVIRNVTDDRYAVDQAKNYTLQVLDPRGRSLHHQDVELDEFGAFHAQVTLPQQAAQGAYRVAVVESNPPLGESPDQYAGMFTVQEFQLDPVRLTIESERTVFYRGEVIEGEIVASYYYGAPIAGKQITYTDLTGRNHTATTDEEGRVPFRLETRELDESQIVTLPASLNELGLSTAMNFIIATQGFSLDVKTSRPTPTYLAGESFEATVTARDAEGKPIAEDITLSVLKRTRARGTNRVGETTVETHELVTDEETGEARVTLHLDEGAQYILRATGVDRFDKAVTGTTLVNVSDDKDGVRLRILAEKHTYKVGDSGKVNLHWREQPALALLTFQGAKILDYRLVELQTGDNELDIPMTAALAPNFQLSVAVMYDIPEEVRGAADGDSADDDLEVEQLIPPQRFHVAESPFAVARDLRVTLETQRADNAGPVRPGEDVEVAVTTTDSQGNPVSAQVSLGMVEKTLADRYGRAESPIGDFFRGAAREFAVQTTSSIVFDYRPATQAINPDLLSEAERLELAEAEESRLLRMNSSIAGSVIAGDFSAGRRSLVVPGLTVRELDRSETLSAVDAPEADTRGPAGYAGQGQAGFGANANGLASGLDRNGRSFFYDGFAQSNAPQSSLPQRQQAASEEELQNLLEDAESRAEFMFRNQTGQQSRDANRAVERGVHLGTAYNRYRADDEKSFFESRKQVESWPLFLGDLGDGDASRAGLDIASYFSKSAEYKQGANDVTVLFADGKQANVNLKAFRFDGVDAVQDLAEELADSGAVIVDAGAMQETGYWNPSIVTDEQGQATVTVALPERSTAWELLAKGVSTETLAGEASTELVASKELFGELKLPSSFTSGDATNIGVSVHNQLEAEEAAANNQIEEGNPAEVEVVLKTTIGSKSTSETRTISVGRGVEELQFPLDVELPEGATLDGTIDFQLTVTSGEFSDVVHKSVPLVPYGERVFATASGAAESDTIAWVEADDTMPMEDRTMEIIVGPSIEQNLMDIVLGQPTNLGKHSLQFASALDTASSELMAALALRSLTGGPESPAAIEAETLDNRIRSSITSLVSSQQDDGSWSWSGRGGGGNMYATARAVWALSEARRGGYRVPESCLDQAVNFLSNTVVQTSESDYESKAVLAHAMAAVGHGDFALLNRLHRNRPSLSSAALAHLSMALVEMNRASMAAELLDLLAERDLDAPATRRRSAQGSLPWNHSSAELHALYALALQKFAPGSPQAKEQVDWLMAHRRGARWAPEKATGPATMAVAQWYSRNRLEHEKYTLTVYVNNVLVETLEIDKDSRNQRVAVPTRLLSDDRQQVNFELTGRGRFAYQCVMSGFVPADKLASTTQDWRVTRQYEPAPLEFDGKAVPRGFDVVQRARPFKNTLTQLPQGERGIVEISVVRQAISNDIPDEQLEYLVITEPIPSGVRVMEDTISGEFERYEITPDAITFFVGNRRYAGTISFQVHGFLPGEYQSSPTIVRDAYRLDSMVVANAGRLSVLSPGQESADEYRLSPRELFELGKRNFDKQSYPAAAGHLDDLFANWTLRPEFYQQTALMLFEINLEMNRPAEIVRLFEIIKERWPDQEIAFDKIARVAQAYEEVGEYERAYLVYRATVEGSFARESRVAGFLESQGEFVRSVKVMDRLLMEYPPEPYVSAATYYLSQRVYAKAAAAETDPELRELKLLRVDLVRDALTRLDAFLTYYPDDPAAAQAAFSAANALLELDAFRPAIAACTKYAERYEDSEYVDSFWYVVGYCHFALGEHQDALNMCQKVADATRVNPTSGREVESPNKWEAVYIMGQVHHSLGEAAEAIEQYEQVKERFADAGQAIDFFTRKDAALPELSIFTPGEETKVNLAYRNVAALDTKVYRIDLTKFGLLRRDLEEVTKINLAGIHPLHESSATLGEGTDYADMEHELDLPLEEEGAYLVVCRADDLHTTGLVVVSPLELEIQQEQASGRVRTTVKDSSSGRYLKDVHVKVIGSRTSEIIDGDTDLRGVFVADNLMGRATVIAQADDGRYAFFRGDMELGAVAFTAGEQAQDQQDGQPAAGAEVQLLEQLQFGNTMIQQEQSKNLENIYNKKDSGVKARSAY